LARLSKIFDLARLSIVARAVKEQYTARIPLGRFGTAEEAARAALFLASPSSSYVTGVELVVDGGLAAT
jgi:NAD(P)-dependent dehydrogenase (short-subunit alcohol dehydrogenase family)